MHSPRLPHKSALFINIDKMLGVLFALRGFGCHGAKDASLQSRGFCSVTAMQLCKARPTNSQEVSGEDMTRLICSLLCRVVGFVPPRIKTSDKLNHMKSLPATPHEVVDAAAPCLHAALVCHQKLTRNTLLQQCEGANSYITVANCLRVPSASRAACCGAHLRFCRCQCDSEVRTLLDFHGKCRRCHARCVGYFWHLAKERTLRVLRILAEIAWSSNTPRILQVTC